jgi:uncharacterized protein
MLVPSRYNHLIQVEPLSGPPAFIVTNLFFGAACFVEATVYHALLQAERDGFVQEARLPGDVRDYLLEKGYLWTEPAAEERLLQDAADALGDRDRLAAALQGGHYGFITSLYCNLACPYCFQQAHADSCGFLTPRQVDLGMEAIARCEERALALSSETATWPKISITGGEPLLRNSANLTVLSHLLQRLDERQWPFSITTNGTDLAQFVAEVEPMDHCRNIQVTLDGPRPVHDRRRRYRNGAGSFDRICEGLDAALSAGWRMTLRVNLDMSNVEQLPALAEFVQAQGWLGHGSFYAYASPVTDHGSVGGYDCPRDEADLLEALLKVIDRAPELRKAFDIRHFRGFDYVERMLVHDDPKFPVFFRCEAVMGMYIFDPHGDLHVCLEAVGDRDLRIGTYDPGWHLDGVALDRWTHRNVLAMPECSHCKIRFICAGGCSIESFNHGGRPCCMPFLREMDLAWEYFARANPDLF